jgi:hypothetical protein
MNNDVRAIYLFKLSENNTGSYSQMYSMCCELITALNKLNIKNRKTQKSFKYPHPEPHNPARHIWNNYKLNGSIHKKLSNMIKVRWLTHGWYNTEHIPLTRKVR